MPSEVVVHFDPTVSKTFTAGHSSVGLERGGVLLWCVGGAGIVAAATVDCFVPSARAGVLAGRGAAVVHWEGVKVSRIIG